MTTVVERFGVACREWCRVTGESQRFMTGPVMVFLGAMDNERRVPQEGVDQDNPDNEFGRFYTIDQMLGYIEDLSDRTGIFNTFLVIGAVKMTDAILTSDVERYGAEKEHFRKSQAEYRDADYMASVGVSPEVAQVFHDGIDHLTTGSLEELKQRRERMLVWRDVYPTVFEGTRFAFV